MYKILYVVNDGTSDIEKGNLLTLLNNYGKEKCVIKVAVPCKSKFIPYLQKAGTEYTEYSQTDINTFKEMLKHEHPDVVHTTFFKPLLTAARKLHIPAVCSGINFNTENRKWWLRLMDKWYKFRTVNRVVAIGMDTPDIEDISKSRVSYIKPGVTRIESMSEDMLGKLRTFYGINKDDFIFVTFADVDGSGGHECLLSAVELLKERCANFKLFICGKGDNDNNIKSYIKVNDLGDNVLFLGDVRDTASVLNVTDVLIDASTVEKNYDIKVLEALSRGVPCILSGSYKNKICAGEFYFTPDDVTELSECMFTLMNNKEIYKNCSEKALSAFNNIYDGKIFAEETENVYLSAVKNISVDK